MSEKKQKEFFIQLGPLADPLQKQLDRQEIAFDKEDARRYERLRKSINDCALGRVLSAQEAENARRRLVAMIQEKAQKGYII